MASEAPGANDRSVSPQASPPATLPAGKDIVLVLSAGAPHSPLTAGALYELHDQLKERVAMVSTSGGGALIGLLWAAPKGRRPKEALKKVLEFGISDEIYRWFPVNYKVFTKPGPFTPHFAKLASRLKRRGPWWEHGFTESALRFWMGAADEDDGDDDTDPPGRSSSPYGKLYEDWIDFWCAMMTPVPLTALRRGLCAPPPFIHKLIDFDKLRDGDPLFSVNAYNLDDRKMVYFTHDDLDEQRLRAALAFPFVYSPVKIDGKYHCEGALFEPIDFPEEIPTPRPARLRGLHGFVIDRIMPEVVFRARGRRPTRAQTAAATDTATAAGGGAPTRPTVNVVLIDIMAQLAPHFTRRPRNMWEAFGLSIMLPNAQLARMDYEHLQGAHASGHQPSAEGAAPQSYTIAQDEPGCYMVKPADEAAPQYRVSSVKFEIPKDRAPRLLEWSDSNLQALWDIGTRAGKAFHLPRP